MQTLRIAFVLIALIVAVSIIIQMVIAYSKADGSIWNKMLAAGSQSATILWNKFTIVLAGLVGTLGDLADALGQPQIKDYLNQALGNPKLVASIMLAASIVTIAARARTMK